MLDNPLILFAVFALVAFLGRRLRAGWGDATAVIGERLRRRQQPLSDAALRLRGFEPSPTAGSAAGAANPSD